MATKKLLSLLLLIVLLMSTVTACGSDSSTTPPTEVTAEEQTAPTNTPQPKENTADPLPEHTETTAPAEAQGSGDAAATTGGGESEGTDDTWLVMFYQDADDEVLERDIFIDLNEAEMIGSTENVTIISQIDRLDGGYDGGGDWNTTKRYLVEKDETGDLETLVSTELEDLGEMDMGDKQTLIDFAVWAIENYPAQKHMLVLSDHGSGWPGGWSDNSPNEGSEMTVNEIDEALAEIVEQTGIGQFDVLGFDACLMSQLEALSGIAPYARYAVASEETEPSLGWAYASFLGELTANPAMSSKELAQSIVKSYIEEDGRILDDDARQAFADELGVKGSVSASQLAEELGADITLTAVDLAAIPALNDALNQLAISLLTVDPNYVAEARSYSQSYTSIFGDDSEAPYLDLGHFTNLLAEAFPDTLVATAVDGVQSAINDAVLAEKHGPDRPGSTGFTFYFPNSDLYEMTMVGDQLNYAGTASRFAAASLWDDYLTYYYTGASMDDATADLSVLDPQSPPQDFSAAVEASAPDENVEVMKPGQGEITFNSLTVDTDEIPIDGAVTLSADITGTNVAYIYIYTSYYSEEYDSYLSTDLDFISSETDKELGGVIYPDWREDENLQIDIDWEPTVYLLSDGETESLAMGEAETYGSTAETTYYRVWGKYIQAGSEEALPSFLRFNANGELVGTFVFMSDDPGAAPREIVLGEGDQFTIEQEWLEFDQNPDGEFNYYDGDTLTYGEAGFTLIADTGMTGSYDIGIIVEDFNGDTYEQYITVNVTE